MKTKTWIIAGLTAVLMSTGSAYAASASASLATQVVITSPSMVDVASVEDLYNSLAAEGYKYITVGRSFLGRAVVEAYNGIEKREIVMNTATAEVISDAKSAFEGFPPESNAAASMSGGMAGSSSGSMTGSMTGGMTGGSTGGMSGGMTGGMTGGSTGGMTGGMSGGMTGGMSGN